MRTVSTQAPLMALTTMTGLKLPIKAHLVLCLPNLNFLLQELCSAIHLPSPPVARWMRKCPSGLLLPFAPQLHAALDPFCLPSLPKTTRLTHNVPCLGDLLPPSPLPLSPLRPRLHKAPPACHPLRQHRWPPTAWIHSSHSCKAKMITPSTPSKVPMVAETAESAVAASPEMGLRFEVKAVWVRLRLNRPPLWPLLPRLPRQWPSPRPRAEMPRLLLLSHSPRRRLLSPAQQHLAIHALMAIHQRCLGLFPCWRLLQLELTLPSTKRFKHACVNRKVCPTHYCLVRSQTHSCRLCRSRYAYAFALCIRRSTRALDAKC